MTNLRSQAFDLFEPELEVVLAKRAWLDRRRLDQAVAEAYVSEIRPVHSQ